MQYKDKAIVCTDCQRSFTWTENDQQFYAQQGYTNPPRRCKACRIKRKEQKEQNTGAERDGISRY